MNGWFKYELVAKYPYNVAKIQIFFNFQNFLYKKGGEFGVGVRLPYKGLSAATQLFKRPSDCLSTTTWLFKRRWLWRFEPLDKGEALVIMWISFRFTTRCLYVHKKKKKHSTLHQIFQNLFIYWGSSEWGVVQTPHQHLTNISLSYKRSLSKHLYDRPLVAFSPLFEGGLLISNNDFFYGRCMMDDERWNDDVKRKRKRKPRRKRKRRTMTMTIGRCRWGVGEMLVECWDNTSPPAFPLYCSSLI